MRYLRDTEAGCALTPPDEFKTRQQMGLGLVSSSAATASFEYAFNSFKAARPVSHASESLKSRSFGVKFLDKLDHAEADRQRAQV
jgi:hypothetical protein